MEVYEGNSKDIQLAVSPWLAMSHADFKSITEDSVPEKCKKGKIFYLQEENSNYVYLIRKGRVALSNISSKGYEKIIFIADEGMMFGKLSVFDGLPNTCCSTVISDTAEIYAIPKYKFQAKLDSDTKFCQQILKTMSQTIRSLIVQIQMITFHSSTSRVCYALIHLLCEYSEKIDNGYKITMTFTHQEIGDLTGLSRVSVSEILSNMVKKGIINKKEGHYIVENTALLYDLLLDDSN